MVERCGLENRCTRKRTEGLNPSLSANPDENRMQRSALTVSLYVPDVAAAVRFYTDYLGFR